jgi:metallophosphoesterase (TIGR00282 family)
MRIGFFGDIVGRSGRDGLTEHLPGLRRRLGLEFVVVNGENAAAGFGITENTARELFDAGADCLTLGNHSWDQKEALGYIGREPRMIRPINYPRLSDAPGRGAWLFDTPQGKRVLVINALGRVHMDALDDPFAAVEAQLESCPLGAACDAIIVDMPRGGDQREGCDGALSATAAASLVVGTHTHIPTADTQILNGGTAYQTDAGACCDYDSVIGMEKTEPLRRFTTPDQRGRFQPAAGPGPTVCGVYVETDPDGCDPGRADPHRRPRLSHVPQPARGLVACRQVSSNDRAAQAPSRSRARTRSASAPCGAPGRGVEPLNDLRPGSRGRSRRDRTWTAPSCAETRTATLGSARAVVDRRRPAAVRTAPETDAERGVAGHSKFKNIMHRRGAPTRSAPSCSPSSAARSPSPSKMGLPDPAMNPRLRLAGEQRQGRVHAQGQHRPRHQEGPGRRRREL